MNYSFKLKFDLDNLDDFNKFLKKHSIFIINILFNSYLLR